jgi:alcohol dehydrogenase class IV
VTETAARAQEQARQRTRGRVSKFLIPEVIFGVGTLAEVGGAVRRVGGTRPMLVSDPGVLAAGWVERALPHLAAVRVEWRVWHDLTPNPKDVEVEAAFESYLEDGCDALVAVGGGSCIDVAKAVAVLSGNGGRILDYEGIDRATGPIPPMVMVPTTGGSGADVSGSRRSSRGLEFRAGWGRSAWSRLISIALRVRLSATRISRQTRGR